MFCVILIRFSLIAKVGNNHLSYTIIVALLFFYNLEGISNRTIVTLVMALGVRSASHGDRSHEFSASVSLCLILKLIAKSLELNKKYPIFAADK